MAKYLIDVNLPYFFSLWRHSDYLHQRDIGDAMLDSEIWAYAKAQDLTIVTKDTDFSNRILLRQPPPRVILIGFGNLRMRDFHERIHACWAIVCELSEQHKLVTVYRDRVEAIA